MEEATRSLWLAVTACELLYSFHLQRGDTQNANRWRLEGEHCLDRELEARHEREFVQSSDEFAAPRLDDDAMRSLRRQLLEFPKIRAAWIAEKRLEHAPESRVYVLSFKTTWFCHGGKLAQKLAGEVQFPETIFFASLDGDTAALAKKVREHGVELLWHSA